MTIHQIPEQAAHPHIGEYGTTVPVRVLTDNGTTAQVLIEGCGILLRQGAIHTVPSAEVQRRR